MGMINNKWWESRFRRIYLVIAIRHFTTPTHVMLIAHGCYTIYAQSNKRKKEKKIVQDLAKYQIIKKEAWQ